MVEAFAAAMLGACVEEVTVMKEEPLFLLLRLVFFRSGIAAFLFVSDPQSLTISKSDRSATIIDFRARCYLVDNDFR